MTDDKTLQQWVEKMTRPARVLVIDDDEDVLKTFTTILSKFECSVTVVTNVEAAISLLKLSRFDLVFLDLVFPIDNGINVLRFIKSKCPSMPVVVVSGLLDSTTIDDINQLGAMTYMRKPVDMNPAFIASILDIFKIKQLPIMMSKTAGTMLASSNR